MLIADTALRTPLVKIRINTLYCVCEVEAGCLPEALYNLFIDNIEGAREPNDPTHRGGWRMIFFFSKALQKSWTRRVNIGERRIEEGRVNVKERRIEERRKRSKKCRSERK